MPPRVDYASASDKPRASRVSWHAVLASMAINLLVWSALVSVYQRASRDQKMPALPRTPIVWLKPPLASPPPDEGAPHLLVQPSHGAADRFPTPPARVSSSPVIEIGSDPPRHVHGDDVWYPERTSAGTARPDKPHVQFAPDPLQLRRDKPFAVTQMHLKIRLRDHGGPAARAQAKVCGALLTQWEGLRMDAASAQAPPGMQLAGREAVWRTLQAEGCLD